MSSVVSKQVKKPEAPEYQMPKPVLGDVIYWYATLEPQEKPLPALVTGIGKRSISLNYFSHQNFNTMPLDGVRHREDPGLVKGQHYEDGVWDFSPQSKRLALLERKLDQIMADLEAFAISGNLIKKPQ